MTKYEDILKVTVLPEVKEGDLLWVTADLPDEELEDLRDALNQTFDHKIAFMMSTFEVNFKVFSKETKHVLVEAASLTKSDLSYLRKQFKESFPENRMSFMRVPVEVQSLTEEGSSCPVFNVFTEHQNIEDLEKLCRSLLESFPHATLNFK